MGRPTEAQAEDFLRRVETIICEWDDCPYALAVLVDGEIEVCLSRGTGFDKIRMARNLLNQVLGDDENADERD